MANNQKSLRGHFRAALAALATLVAPTTAISNDLGSQVYARNCAVCHGDDGAGAVWTNQSLRRPPRNFRSDAARAELTGARIRAAVVGGVPGTAMMSFATQLSRPEIDAVVQHIETRFLARAASAASNDDAYPSGLRGDYRWGQVFYRANCATCHGELGDGRGPRAYFIMPPPRNFLDSTSRSGLTRAALFAAVADGRIGKEMPAWRQVLTPQEIANVSEFVYREFVRPGKDRVR